MPGFIGLPEIIVVLVIILIIFGPKRLPELGRSIGSGMRNFKESVGGKDKGRDEVDAGTGRPEAAEEPEHTAPTAEPNGSAGGHRGSADVRS
jgi:sec-independent protein translocase protein TatA